MNQRERNSRNQRVVYTGSNVLFTLGLISVVVLLIVGFIMTQGGMNTIAEKGMKLVSIPIYSTPTAGAVTAPVVSTSHPLGESGKKEYEEKIRQLQEASQKREEELRNQYQRQIDDLRVKIQILEDENKRLRGGK